MALSLGYVSNLYYRAVDGLLVTSLHMLFG